ncbi:MAG: class I SAM-dependent methyltransferase [Candidatus Omnitrophota bacterium]|jgi:hypothetical protein|nr:MAG: class I SAM-dependent methyltransferase [Candidatus Omnitrophota bacterium]
MQIRGKNKKIIIILIALVFIYSQLGLAQILPQVDFSGIISGLRNSLSQESFRPASLRYLEYDSATNNFKVFIDKGDEQDLSSNSVENILQFFFIALSLPKESFWVNLRPDASQVTIDDNLAKTDFGKVLLEADLQLKKDTAKYTSPATKTGRQYWDKLYKKAGEIFGNQNLNIPTLARPWIVPDEIIIRQAGNNAYIYKASLKVMLEQDFLKDSDNYKFDDPKLKALNEYASELMRQFIIPELIKDVNTAKRYSLLRRVYNSLILAQWFKARYAGSSSFYPALVDKGNLTGLTSEKAWDSAYYFNEYKKSFESGEYNLKEPVFTAYGQSVRTYFSGGIALNNVVFMAPSEQVLGTTTLAEDTKMRIIDAATPQTLPFADYLIAAEAVPVSLDRLDPFKVTINIVQSPEIDAQGIADGVSSPVSDLAFDSSLRFYEEGIARITDDFPAGARSLLLSGIERISAINKAYYELLQSFNEWSKSRPTYIYPLRGLDLIVDAVGQTQAINDDLTDLSIPGMLNLKVAALDLDTSQIERISRAGALDKRQDALNSASYRNLLIDGRENPYVLILKGFNRFAGQGNQDRAREILEYLFTQVLREGDKVLILDKSDLPLESIAESSGFVRLPVSRDSLTPREDIFIKYGEKTLLFPTAFVVLEKKASSPMEIIRRVRGKASRYYGSWPAEIREKFEQGVIDYDTMGALSMTTDLALNDEEERALWQVFHAQNPDLSDRGRLPEDIFSTIDNRLTEKGGNKVRVLEIGSGPHAVASGKLKEKYGDSIESFAIDLGLANSGMQNGVFVAAADVKHLPFASGYFDVIFESGVLVYFRDQDKFRQAIGEIERVLNPDSGKLIVEEKLFAGEDGIENQVIVEEFPSFTSRYIDAASDWTVLTKNVQPSPATIDFTSSSPIEDANDYNIGGIDFRNLPITISEYKQSRNTNNRVYYKKDKESQQLEDMINGGIIPSVQRIKDYILASAKRGEFAAGRSNAINCIAQIMRLQESKGIPSAQELNDLLSLLESENAETQLQNTIE